MELNLNLLARPALVGAITDGNGATVALADARRMYESGEPCDYNLAFLRLAQMDFDLPACIAYYGIKVQS